jgi:hypothetical protein
MMKICLSNRSSGSLRN